MSSATAPNPDVIELDDEEEGTEDHKKAMSWTVKSQSSRGHRRQEVSASVGGRQDGVVDDVEDQEKEGE